MKRIVFLASVIATLLLAPSQVRVHTFKDPIDALSIGFETDDPHLEVSALVDGAWQEWNELEIEKEFDPLLRESNLILFPKKVTAIRTRGTVKNFELHPIRLSNEPASYQVAARNRTGTPRILTRSQWKANDDFLFTGEEIEKSDITTPKSDDKPVSKRVQDCLDAKKAFPDEFAIVRTETHVNGRKLRWARKYADGVDYLVVHHSAIPVTGDTRSSLERMRALYEYHSNGRGWGDIGYHYVIGKDGQIYEGKSGGDLVNGGHAYCHNNRSLGIVVDGHFEEEQPNQRQMQSLKWLMDHLAVRHNIALNRDTTIHGKKQSPIVGHGNLVNTACPGYYLKGSLGQVIRQTIAKDFNATVKFPKKIVRKKTTGRRIGARRISRISRTNSSYQAREPELSVIGSAQRDGRPGGILTLQLKYTAGDAPIPRNARLASIRRSHPRIGLWLGQGDSKKRLRQEITTKDGILPGKSEMLHLTVKLPVQEGTYDVRLDDLLLTFNASGRRVQSQESRTVRKQSFKPAEEKEDRLISPERRRSIGRDGQVRSRGRARAEARTRTETVRSITSRRDTVQDAKIIRIRLSYEGDSAILTSSAYFVNLNRTPERTIRLKKKGDHCHATNASGEHLAAGTVRLLPENGVSTIVSWDHFFNRFRGIIECRIIDNQLVLINELPLEDYMRGLGEEPDTQHYTKQLVIAVAARSYAAHYMGEKYRKFPGMPYDLDDSPARSQKYSGAAFEELHPRWVQSVNETSGEILMKNGDIIKAAYFSSSDGRTRSPDELGWYGYPHKEVFESKPDPGCTEQRGHGVGLSACGAGLMAEAGKSYKEILKYYYPGTVITTP